MSQAEFNQSSAHKHFAVAFNQLTWELLGQAKRSQVDEDRLRYAAYASAMHWSVVGTQVEISRAEWLISRMHCVLGDPVGALRHAQRCMQIMEGSLEGEGFKAGSGFKDFDLAYGVEAMARAHALAGQSDQSAQFQKLARALGDAIEGPEDKKIFMGDLDAGPWNPNGERF